MKRNYTRINKQGKPEVVNISECKQRHDLKRTQQNYCTAGFV